MKRRDFLALTSGLLLSPKLLASDSSDSARFQINLLKVGKHWQERQRALIKLSYEVQKRCNIPIESNFSSLALNEITKAGSPFFIISGRGTFDPPTPEEAGMLRLVLGGGGLLLFDDSSLGDDKDFYTSAINFMNAVYPEHGPPRPIPQDHAVYQSYYLLKKPRGRTNRKEYLEGWDRGPRTRVFFSHNDLLGAMEADKLGNWTHNMELGGGLRRELCFRLAINMTYYTLTINYKKDRAFPPIIERRRRL